MDHSQPHVYRGPKIKFSQKENRHFCNQIFSTVFFPVLPSARTTDKKRKRTRRCKKESEGNEEEQKKRNNWRNNNQKRKRTKEKKNKEKKKKKKRKLEQLKHAKKCKKKKRKMKKCKKNGKQKTLKNEICEYFQGSGLHTKNPRRFPGFAVVVIFSTKSSTVSMSCFRDVCFFLKKSTTHLGSHGFSEEKRPYLLDMKQKQRFADEINDTIFG